MQLDTQLFTTIDKTPKDEWKQVFINHNVRNLWGRFDTRHYCIGVPKRFENARLHHFGDRVVDLALGKSVFLYGKSGTGKSHLMAALALRHTLMDLGMDVPPEKAYARFVCVPDLLAIIKQSFGKTGEDSEEEVFSTYANAQWLYLDDLGSEQSTDWSFMTLYRIVNHRYNNLLPMVVTSNLRLEDIAGGFSERIASRLLGMCECIEMSGRDRRGDK